MVLMASPAVNLPLWTQEGGRTGQVDQFPPGTEVPGLGYLGNGVGGGRSVSRGRQGSSAVESTPAQNLHQAPALLSVRPIIVEEVISPLCKVMAEDFSAPAF